MEKIAKNADFPETNHLEFFRRKKLQKSNNNGRIKRRVKDMIKCKSFYEVAGEVMGFF